MIKVPNLDIDNDEIASLITCIPKNNLPFLIEKDNFKFVDNLKDADIIPLKANFDDSLHMRQINFLQANGITDKQLLLVMLIYNDCDTYDYVSWFEALQQYYKNNSNYKLMLLHNNHHGFSKLADQNNIIYYDHMFNREKAYFTDFNRILPYNKIYTEHSEIENFKLRPLIKNEPEVARRVFLCPNRIYQNDWNRVNYRRRLKSIIENKNGYMSDPFNNIFLEPEQVEMQNIYTSRENRGGGTWFPVANKYYENSYVSIFVESIVVTEPNPGMINPWKAISEKSYDPLIKGHFILPFAYSGIIQDLKNMGFLFPDWIDYSYDGITNDENRFVAYIKEVEKIVNMETSTLHDLWEKNLDLLEHNRSIFWKRPYSTLHDKLMRFL